MPHARPTPEELESAVARRPARWAAYAHTHDTLLAARAHPTSAEVFARTAEWLAAHSAHARRLRAPERAHGDDSGLDGTVSRHTFDHGTTEWLVRRFPDDVEVDWRNSHASEALEALLRPVVLPAEEDAFDAESISMRRWVRAARGSAWPSDLAWLLNALQSTGDARLRRSHAWDAASLPIQWTLRHSGTAHALLPTSECAVRGDFRRPPARIAPLVRTPMRDIRLLRGSAAARAVDTAREALAARCREVHAISYANPDEVWYANLGEGSALVLYGVVPEFRLSLEANYGYLLLSNGVPVGYGGVSPLFRQANTGINVFEPFRGTEAAYLWVRALQAFRTMFGVGRFVVNPYQVGGGNAEALDSGAFWFYHRLGFRPASPALRTLAASEAAKRRGNPRHRSARAILRELAGADLYLTLPGFGRDDAFDEAWLARIALRATERVAEEGKRDRRDAVRQIADRVAARLGVSLRGVPVAERQAWMQLAPVVDLVPDLERWPVRERHGLSRMIGAKGALRERGYARMATRQARFFRALAECGR